MSSQCLYLLVIFTFQLPISLACDSGSGPMNGICTPCGQYCGKCYGDTNYCTRCEWKALLRGKCQCDAIGCNRCDGHDSSKYGKCTDCKYGFYPIPSSEGDCNPCPENCPYCGHKWGEYELCYRCFDPGEGYNRSTCTWCSKNCVKCQTTSSPTTEFNCKRCESGFAMTPTKECTACIGDNCSYCQFEDLDKCYVCKDGTYYDNFKCITNPPNCKYAERYSAAPVECKSCNDYFYLTPDKICKPNPQEGCKLWDNINKICYDGCDSWDDNEGVCTRCLPNYFPLTTYSSLDHYKRCNLTCNTVTYTNYVPDDYNSYYFYCLTENKCPPGYYLNKYRNCLSCGGDLCTNCTEEGCVTSANADLIELFAEDWKGRGESFGKAISDTDCDYGQYIYNETYCFKDKCPNGLKVNGTICVDGSPAAYGVSFSLIFIFLILLI